VDFLTAEASTITAHNPFSRLLRFYHRLRAWFTKLHEAKVCRTRHANGAGELAGQTVSQIARLQRGRHIITVTSCAHHQYRHRYVRQALWRKATREPQI